MGSRKPRPGADTNPPEDDEVAVTLQLLGPKKVSLQMVGDPDDVISLLNEDAAFQLRREITKKYGDGVDLKLSE